jgi:hypothetical protein
MTNVMRKSATRPAMMSASRYPRAVAAIVDPLAVKGLIDSAIRATLKTQRSPSSCSGVRAAY